MIKLTLTDSETLSANTLTMQYATQGAPVHVARAAAEMMIAWSPDTARRIRTEIELQGALWLSRLMAT